MFERLAAPFCWACTFPPVAKLIAKAWGLICAYPWLHNFAADMWRLGVTSIKERYPGGAVRVGPRRYTPARPCSPLRLDRPSWTERCSCSTPCWSGR
jgi:hypothetical protein